MALINAEILRAILPNIGLPVNLDGTYRIGVEDVNSDEILAALLVIAAGGPTTIADGADVTQGAIADAVVAAGAVGTLSAKLRRLTTDTGVLVVDLAAIEIINTAIQVATEASAVDLAAIEVINTAIQAAIEAQGEGDYATPTHTQPVIAAGTTVALAANANRLYACLVNDGTEPIYIKLGVAAVMNQGIRLNAAGGSYEMSREIGNLYVGAINGICASGGMTLVVTEGV
ncbi:MAG: hypothetical protein KAS32_17455 [Candidatus Peribacteraceae bacterium]|nr:hypothetical protein [Candidatus Peribacteraceae bacterium]